MMDIESPLNSQGEIILGADMDTLSEHFGLNETDIDEIAALIRSKLEAKSCAN